jgi:transposase-like protein
MTATLVSGPTPWQTGRPGFSCGGTASLGREAGQRKFAREFKEAAVRRLELGATVAEVSRRCEVNANVLLRWRREMRNDAGQAFACAARRDHQQESDVVELERKVGRQALVKTMQRQTQIRHICSKTICYLRSNIGPPRR